MLSELIKERCIWGDDVRLLDFGCGVHGNVAVSLCQLAGQTVAVDIDDEAVRKFNEKCQLQGLEEDEVCGIRSDLFHASKRWLNYFDICTAVLVYHHLDSPLETSELLFRHLKPGGKLVVIDLFKNDGIRGFNGPELTGILQEAGFVNIHVEDGPKITLHKSQTKTHLLIVEASKSASQDADAV